MLTFATTIGGTPDEKDLAAARLIVTRENERRAALDPPEDPLPTSTPVEIRAGFLTVLDTQILPNAHASWIREAAEIQLAQQDVKSLWRDATDAQRAAAVAALQA